MLYIHIPFCRNKCVYCDFYSIRYKKGLSSELVNVLCKQIKQIDQGVNTVFVGGGTPTVLDESSLKKLFKELAKIPKVDEFTVEVNPESLTKEKLAIFKDCGVNRISIGIQSFSDLTLQKLGRIHNASEGKKAIDLVKKSGINNISIDLIFGVWGQGLDEWQKDLTKAVKLPVKHISTYSLTYEKNTPLIKQALDGSVIPLSDSRVVGMYKFAMSYLPRQKFGQYEVSNFAKKGFECKHNLGYWDNEPYIGLGPSAAFYQDGTRGQNISDVTKYIQGAKSNKSIVASREKLTPLQRAKEAAAIKIRTAQGINFKKFKERTGYDFMTLQSQPIAELIADKYVKFKASRGQKTGVYLTKRGFLFCDTVSSSLL